MRRNIAIWLAAAVLALPWSGGMVESSQGGPVAIDARAGWRSFEEYCAPCHGTSGRGDGPMAPALRKRPTDLTRLAERNRGTYPGDHVRELIVDSAKIQPAHGSKQMPVWGPVFRRFESDALAAARIENLVAYVQSLQHP